MLATKKKLWEKNNSRKKRIKYNNDIINGYSADYIPKMKEILKHEIFEIKLHDFLRFLMQLKFKCVL